MIIYRNSTQMTQMRQIYTDFKGFAMYLSF